MKRLAPLAVSLAILGAIFAQIDRAALWENIKLTRPIPFTIAIFLFLPQNLIIVYRWKRMASNFIPMGWKDAAMLILAGQSMNVILPSKMGDLTKAWFLKQSGVMDLPRAIHLVIFEKMLDLGSLCLLALVAVPAAYAFGVESADSGTFALLAATTAIISSAIILAVGTLYFVPTRRIPFLTRIEDRVALKPGVEKIGRFIAASHEVSAMLQARHARRGLLITLSVFLWMLHMVQIYFFFLCLNAPVPILPYAVLMPLAIFVGLLPISLFGMGTRDAAVIFLFRAYHPPAILAGVGLYVGLRYVIPALTGLPFLHRYWTGRQV